MAIFFFFVSLEIKREFIQGELSNPKKAMLPIIGAVGGMAIPAYFILLLIIQIVQHLMVGQFHQQLILLFL